MKALILAAGAGRRLAGNEGRPKSLLEFGGVSLLDRHLSLLRGAGIREIAIVTGFARELIETAIDAAGARDITTTLFNPDFERGSLVSLWTAREYLRAGDDLLLMDADVLYDARMLAALTGTRHRGCFLLDRDLEPGDEPVKLCVRGGRIVEFRKQVPDGLDYDFHGESVGFFRLASGIASRLADRTQDYVAGDRLDEHYEEALRDLVLADRDGVFGFEDVTGIPWIEIDFPDDIERARREILPRLET